MSWPAPVVICCAGPARRLRASSGSRHTFIPPPGVGRVVEHPPVARPRRVDLPVHVAGDDGGRTRGDVDDGDIEPRAVDVLIRDALPVGRPARLHVRHRLRRVRRDLRGVEPARVDGPDAPRAGPRRIDGDRAAVGGHVGRIRVGDDLLLALRRNVHRPHVSLAALVRAEHVAGLEAPAGGVRPHEQHARSVGRPRRLDVVVIPRRELLRVRGADALHEQLANATALAGVHDALAVGGPRGELLDALG